MIWLAEKSNVLTEPIKYSRRYKIFSLGRAVASVLCVSFFVLLSGVNGSGLTGLCLLFFVFSVPFVFFTVYLTLLLLNLVVLL